MRSTRTIRQFRRSSRRIGATSNSPVHPEHRGGHVNPTLSQKTLEWRPEVNTVLTKPGASAEAFLGYAVLESAINTFVDGERHRIFDSDTDLAYPPDLTRFLNFLGSTVHVGIADCAAVAAAALERAHLPDFNENWLELSAKAGTTDFAFITRKG